ncbi:MAG: phosphatidate cytidylyltransferase [Bacillota bacterium]
MIKRFITSILLIPLFLFLAFKGGLILSIAIGIISTIALFEFYRVFNNLDKKPNKMVGLIFNIIFLIVIYNKFDYHYIIFLLFVFTMILLIYNLFSKKDQLINSMITFFGVFYIPLGFFHLILLERITYDYIVFIPFLISWGCDTFAYFIGKKFGKRKLMPSVSPKKTKEGAIAGIFGSIFLNYLLAKFFIPEILDYIILISFIGSIFSQLGDLMASKIKRKCNVSDFGHLLPGHGGILDRFDSTVITIPVVYYLILVIF